ncbi:cytochrome P450 monooxygenase [Parathielavia hyrcaniae]|uniref:Cytochrome P450 monooxygenase n=1 Tax=Parathielavia hyrcaniae TaxID=113614 RepID=A0AAN6PSU9_9PEZI|nr:cytochrome P450 monooxygenase [Parathielavia hyrcaniae]
MSLSMALSPGLWCISFLAIVVAASLVRWLLLPKPLPRIPYSQASARRIAGDIPELGHAKGVRAWMRDLFATHNSPIVQVFMSPFSRPWVLIADYNEAYDIQVRRFKEFEKSGMTIANFRGIIPNGFVSMKAADAAFQHNKELVSHLMAPTFLNHVSAPEIYRNFVFLLELWDLKLEQGKGKPFQADRDMYMVALDIIMAVTFDHRSSNTMIMRQTQHLKHWYNHAHAREDASGNKDNYTNDDPDEPFSFPTIPLTEDLAALMYITESLNVAFQSPFPRLAHWLYLQKPVSRRALQRKRDLIHRNIDASLARLEAHQHDARQDNAAATREPLCALDEIILRGKDLASQRQPQFDPRHDPALEDEVFTYVVGGHDTSATLFNWFVKFMARSPAAQARLRSALLSAHSSSSESCPDPATHAPLPTAQDIIQKRIPYLEAVIAETLRCAHIVPITAREALVDTTVLGCRIPRGTHVFFLANAASTVAPAFGIDEALRTRGAREAKRKVGVWEAEGIGEFTPERWLKNMEGGAVDESEGGVVFDPLAGPQLAFGGGPRGCFGRRLAELELRIVVTLLVWKFEFLKVGGGLDGLESVDSSTEVPRDCFVRLRRVQA